MTFSLKKRGNSCCKTLMLSRQQPSSRIKLTRSMWMPKNRIASKSWLGRRRRAELRRSMTVWFSFCLGTSIQTVELYWVQSKINSNNRMSRPSIPPSSLIIKSMQARRQASSRVKSCQSTFLSHLKLKSSSGAKLLLRPNSNICNHSTKEWKDHNLS